MAEVDPAILDDKAERVNITSPRRVLARLDAHARAAGETRSGYIAKLPSKPDRRADTRRKKARSRRASILRRAAATLRDPMQRRSRRMTGCCVVIWST